MDFFNEDRRSVQDLLNEVDVLMAAIIEEDTKTEEERSELFLRAMSLLMVSNMLTSPVMLN